MRKLKAVIDVLCRPRLLRFLLSVNSSGYLKESGWINSFNNSIPVGLNDNPVPWVTLPFIDFVAGRLTRDMEILEFGSGNSTLWYAEKVKLVTSVEHDSVWFERIKNIMPKNVTLNHEQLGNGDQYAMFAALRNNKFHMIVVDGRDRVNCIINSIASLTDDGVIVLDDSERESYTEGMNILRGSGFKRLDFWGVSPGLFYKKCTTVFYRDGNCLGI